MKFVCSGMALSDASMTVSKACAVKTTNPVFEGIEIIAENDGVILTASDGEITIKKKIVAEVFEEGAVSVKGKMFADFVSKISAFEVVFSADDRGIVLRYADSESYMPLYMAGSTYLGNEDPTLGKEYFEIKEEDFKSLISKIVFCCATDESRPILKGALLETKNGKLTATAIDGFRLAYGSASILEGSADMKIICPARTLNEISRMLEDGNTIKVYADKNYLCVVEKDTVIKSRLYAGEFVKKEAIYPIDLPTQVTVKREDLIESVERASVLIRGEKEPFIMLDVKPGKMVITANSEMGKIEETLVCELNGKEIKTAMNFKYLLEATKALTEENVVLSFNQPVSPFTMENEKEKEYQYLIMPVRPGNNA